MTRQPGQLHPVPTVPCTCPAGYSHPNRDACYRHGKQWAVDRAARLVRSQSAHAALEVLVRAARRPWWSAVA